MTQERFNQIKTSHRASDKTSPKDATKVSTKISSASIGASQAAKSPLVNLDPDLNFPPKKPLKGLRVHLLGIGGVAMASLAGQFKVTGAKVTGSDLNVYPPVSQILSRLRINFNYGYDYGAIPENVDLVIVGNVITINMPVVAQLRDLAIAYLSLPQALSHYFLSETKNLVIAGCHGKTTMTNMAAKIFETGSFEPGFLIGGDSLDFPAPFREGRPGGWFIIEGDEYDSAFFNKEPKFIHYRPQTVILSSVDYDHADIYPNPKSLYEAYERLMGLISPKGLLIANGDDLKVRQIASAASCRKLFYGVSNGSPHKLDIEVGFYEPKGMSGAFYLKTPYGPLFELNLNRPGLYNALNAAACAGAFLDAGGTFEDLAISLSQHKGVKRRQQIIWPDAIDVDKPVLIDDFAHHPGAVAKTLEALRGAFPERRIIAAFEPRSNTTRRAIFQDLYPQALSLADWVFLAPVDNPLKAPAGDRLDLVKLCDDIGTATVTKSISDLAYRLLRKIKSQDVIVMMSNGGFGGLKDKLISKLTEKYPPDIWSIKHPDDGVALKEANSFQDPFQDPYQEAKSFKEPFKEPFEDRKPDPKPEPNNYEPNNGIIENPERFDKLAASLGVTFKELSLYQAAMTHRSMLGGVNKTTIDGETSNQRLEFLGDAVLDLCIAELLFPIKPRLNEGQMTRLKSWMVCEARLGEVAFSLNLGQYIVMSPGERACGGASKFSVLSDAMEALIAALFFDLGYDQTKKVVANLWAPYFSHDFLMLGPTDAKTSLQEAAQSIKIGLPIYMTKVYGPPHSPMFVSKANLDSFSGIGKGSSKKEAEQDAARNLLVELCQYYPDLASRFNIMGLEAKKEASQ
ncbi:MAG: ribonuclease III [Deltaproteobacteria bacterium]|jgi:UDP-N-acetylmuramate: L-alanyl-gamma-D-glutamyl-meso-diaminopimelate ligase|nr:ribonuclease III [Deltaproteobacteria bacterium]